MGGKRGVAAKEGPLQTDLGAGGQFFVATGDGFVFHHPVLQVELNLPGI